MNYYEVIPASNRYQSPELLTYSYEQKLETGQIVKLQLRGAKSLGIIFKETVRPSFDTLKIDSILQGMVLPVKYLALLGWIMDFYPGAMGITAQLFVPSFLEGIKGNDAIATTTKFSMKSSPITLTSDQAVAYGAITSKSKGKTYILQGITGSGKTRLYMELAKDSLKQRKSVIILTPEISLTAPVAKQFKQFFGEIVRINHSSLTPKQRRQLWVEALTSRDPIIIIGPRSSLFLPLKNLGLIVSDEFHEQAYKQDSKPFYHANRVASMLASLFSAKMIFGSATPPIADYFLAMQKKVPIIKMDHLAITGKEPDTESLVIDMLDEKEKSNYPLLSRTLIKRIAGALAEKEQIMLFINKRGSARSVSCQDCGFRELCKNCDLPMIYHGDEHLIRCHTCGFSKAPPNKCPVCGSVKIYFSNPGTKAIVDSLSKMFPKARIARFDSDNKKTERFENVYDKVLNDVDIIVGTQIIIKGHDLPRLSIAAMLVGDNELIFPDFSATERTYQTIKQLQGRVNRGHKRGVFIVQTFNPSSKLIRASLDSNWKDFYNDEIAQRKKHGFPPFYYVAKVESARKSAKSSEESLEKLIKKMNLDPAKFEVLGPSPCFVEKKSSKWYWQILIKSRSRSDLAKVAGSISKSFKVNIDPSNFL